MPNPINISNSNNLAPFLKYFEDKGIEWRSVATEYNFPENIDEENIWLSSHQVMAFLHAMMKNTKKNIGVDVGRLITLDQLSPELLREFKQCNDVEHAVQRLIELMPTFNNYVVVWPSQIEGKWYLCHRGSYHPSLPGYDQAEWFRTFALISLFRLFLGNRWEPRSIFMSFSQHLVRDLSPIQTESTFRFGHDFGAIELPLPQAFVAIESQRENSRWIENITALINTYAVLPWFNIDWLSRLVGSSSRTLQRVLANHGFTFRELRDQARHSAATKLLANGVSPFETGWRCGYSDLSNFNRAFKAWSGKTPSQFQKTS
ncbi:helix-turn-helix domain-containing protein [Vibrio methylphosphonaticus]|uniref:helix-turn-helix domain-containing protein n=1 Tax=Vibrio methylphosphonaticus TaxID=2946866 RepID=UPI00202A4C67|nr:helix-turn-helix domain-containing protein [Vibrio methylphosphonaticus]MCL9773763.1 helix-turn-helix domain-containing protein [Vibrio methylphosphonaticus]